jgi:hypothetical protein
VTGGEHRAEVLGVERAGLPFGERRRRARFDPDACFPVRRVEDVRAVLGGGHPRVDDRLRRGQPQGAPRDVLAHRVPPFRAGQVAARADPVERCGAVGGDVGEVVFVGHFPAVPLCGARQLLVGRQRRLAVARAFLVDQALDRCAHLFDVRGRWGRGGVGAGRLSRRGHAPAERQREQRGEGEARHAPRIGSRVPWPEHWAEVWTPFAMGHSFTETVELW